VIAMQELIELAYEEQLREQRSKVEPEPELALEPALELELEVPASVNPFLRTKASPKLIVTKVATPSKGLR
jgi:hypothetical protein